MTAASKKEAEAIVKAFGAHKLVNLSVDKVTPYPNNPRRRTKDSIEKIAASIRATGFNNPILVDDDNVILAGHGRYEAAKLIGLKIVPCIKLSGLDEAKKRAYRIADNRAAEESEWDQAKLSEELLALSREGFDLAGTAFDVDELAKLSDEFVKDLPAADEPAPAVEAKKEPKPKKDAGTPAPASSGSSPSGEVTLEQMIDWCTQQWSPAHTHVTPQLMPPGGAQEWADGFQAHLAEILPNTAPNRHLLVIVEPVRGGEGDLLPIAALVTEIGANAGLRLREHFGIRRAGGTAIDQWHVLIWCYGDPKLASSVVEAGQ